MIDKERKIKDTERLYLNLRDVLLKQPTLQTTMNLNKFQSVLRKRGDKIKVSIQFSIKKKAFIFLRHNFIILFYIY